MFLAPVKLYDSGISGTSMLLAQITPEWLTLSIFLIILNFPLFLFGLKRQGVCFTVYSIYAISIYSIGAWLITDVLPVDTSFVSPLAGSDLLLCALFGGLISGVGSGLTIIDAKGYYSSSRKSVIYFVVNRFQIGKMRSIVHETDSSAYITICEIADVYQANREKEQ